MIAGRDKASDPWYRFVPDAGDATSFSASDDRDAQQFAAERFHGIPGVLVRLEAFRNVRAAF